MRRHCIAPRANAGTRLAALGFALAGGAEREYWNESAAWELTRADVAVLEAATLELNRLCLQAAGHAVRHDMHEIFGIPASAWPLVRDSWHRGEPSIYGRMDLRWDGTGAPQLLEFNADTPTALYEAAVLQWDWLIGTRPEADQYNGIHEALIARWRAVACGGAVHFTCMGDQPEDRITVDYMRDTALQAGSDAPFVDIADIGWDGTHFVDPDRRVMRRVFKLYPAEWMFREAFGGHIASAGAQWMEPPWRLMLGSKGLLALLWQLFPGHPNLLPAYRTPQRCGGPEIAKPLFGREGANIRAPGLETDGPFGDQPCVYQAFRELPCVGGNYPVLGSWVIGGRAVGIGFREDSTPITRDTSCFVPHFIAEPDTMPPRAAH